MQSFRFVITLAYVLVSAMIFVDDCVAQPRLVEFEYGKILVLRQSGESELALFTVLADPVLYTSKAYIVLHEVDSIARLNEYLELQSKAGTKVPKNVIVRSQVATLSNPDSTFVSIFKRRALWLPGGAHEGTLDLSGLNAPVQIAELEPHLRIPKFSEKDFMDLEAYDMLFRARRKEWLDSLEINAIGSE